jgi:ribosome-associated toxin RatA of RatAB toxin-antitoxin module
MASAETNELFNCTVPQFYKIVADYEKYPEFLSEVKKCRVVKDEGARKLVEFSVSVIKTFTYSMWLTETPDQEIRWEFASGEVFKTSSGYWKLTDEAGKARAHYHVEATFSLFVPGPIAKALVSVNLPNMMSSYHKRVQQLYGK